MFSIHTKSKTGLQQMIQKGEPIIVFNFYPFMAIHKDYVSSLYVHDTKDSQLVFGKKKGN